MIRWLKFNTVGIAGAALQLASLWLLTRAGMHYLLATAIAVEVAILHNFYWHVRWTWKDRHPSLLRFHLANGLVSILSNLALMKIFTGLLSVPPVPANLAAIGITSLLNFFLGDRWVFSPGGRSRSRERLNGGSDRGLKRLRGQAIHKRSDDPAQTKRYIAR